MKESHHSEARGPAIEYGTSGSATQLRNCSLGKSFLKGAISLCIIYLSIRFYNSCRRLPETKRHITKNSKLYIYQTIIQSILVYGAEVWQIPTKEINKILSTDMDVLRRSVRKSGMERIKNEYIKEIMGVKGKPDIIDII